ncbi:MAG: FG-GAP repeat domain-containing protein, partial [Planctomycetota bacterium]
EEDGYRPVADHPLARVDGVRFAAFADVDGDGRTDAYLGRRGPNRLFLRTETGDWMDATGTSGTEDGDHDTTDARFVDADHDGDLDILLANADGPANLLNNDRDGGFTSIAGTIGLDAATGGVRVLSADLDGTRDLDLLVIRDAPPHLVLLNDRLWNYRADDAAFERIRQADLVLATSGDLDGDGVMDLVTCDRSGDIHRWARDEAGIFDSTVLHSFDAPPANLAMLDPDGDGRFEIVTNSTLGLDDTANWTPILEDPRRPSALQSPRWCSPVLVGSTSPRSGSRAATIRRSRSDRIPTASARFSRPGSTTRGRSPRIFPRTPVRDSRDSRSRSDSAARRPSRISSSTGPTASSRARSPDSVTRRRRGRPSPPEASTGSWRRNDRSPRARCCSPTTARTFVS